MNTAESNFRVVNTLADYAELCGVPPPANPLVTILDLTQSRRNASPNPAVPFKPIVQNFYSIALKRGLKGTVYYGRQKHDFQAGVLTFMAPGQVFAIDADLDISEVSGWSLLFQPELLAHYPLGKKISEYEFFGYASTEALHVSPEEETTLDQLLRNIEREYRRPIDTFSYDVIVAQLETLLIYAERYYRRQFITRSRGESDLVARFEQLLNAHFAEEGERKLPTVQEFADALHVSPAYLSSMLRSLTGQSAQQHLHRKLIEYAKQLLLNSSLTVSEAAFELGFEYPQYFSRLFKQKTGQTPGEFRSSALWQSARGEVEK